MGKTQPKTTQRSMPRKRKTTEQTLRSKILDHFRTLKIPLGDDEFGATIGEAEREGLSHLQLLDRLLGRQAEERRQRSLERRIREARFAEVKTLEQFDWQFNAKTIDRSRIEELATGEFIRRGDNLIAVGQSGVGKSHIFQALGRKSCELEYRVRYTTSADLLASGQSASWNSGTPSTFVVLPQPPCAPTLSRRSRRCFLNGTPHTLGAIRRRPTKLSPSMERRRHCRRLR